MITTIALLIAGLLLLLLGRKIYWLFVGLVGFAAGYFIATNYIPGIPENLVVLVAIGVGLVGLLLAKFVQRFAMALAGFIAGGYLLMMLVASLELDNALMTNLAFIVGGVLGAVFLNILLDWALILLSSGVGSYLALEALGADLGGWVRMVTMLVIAFTGVAIQSAAWHREQGKEKKKNGD
ncbi:MAG: hypothetical protein HPY76_05050 [Anaerolineae bacterium]|nr:hypothetical protein [Anaerolineae bacterium]